MSLRYGIDSCCKKVVLAYKILHLLSKLNYIIRPFIFNNVWAFILSLLIHYYDGKWKALNIQCIKGLYSLSYNQNC